MMLAALFVPPAHACSFSPRFTHPFRTPATNTTSPLYTTHRTQSRLLTACSRGPSDTPTQRQHELEHHVPELPEIMEPQDIPQTMERAIVDAQRAVLNALGDGERRVVCELPMGRLRAQWNTKTAPSISYQHTLQLYPHLLVPLRDGGADVRIVYDAEVCGADRCMGCEWISQRHQLTHAVAQIQQQLLCNLHECTIIVFVGISAKYRHSPQLCRLIDNTPLDTPILLFNCFLESQFVPNIYPPPFTLPTSVAYMCRAVDRLAFARYGHRDAWHLFVEISTFEYESIDSIPTHPDDPYAPTVRNIQKMARARGALVPKDSVFYASASPGRNAGFWPFMTLHRKYLYPLYGDTYRDAIETDASRKRKSTPFGFF